MNWRHLMILAAAAFALAAIICAGSVVAAPPVTVVISPEQVNVQVSTQGDNVTIDDGTTAVQVTTQADEIMTVTTAGEQGIPGPSGADGPAGPGVPGGGTPGQVLGKSGFADYSTAWVDPPAGGGGGVSSWNDLTDKPASFPPSAHTQGIDTVTGLQTALDGKAGLGADVNFGNITMPDNTAIFIGGSGGLAGTTIDNGQIDVGSVYTTWIGNTFSDRISAGSLKTMLNHLFTLGNVHSLEASQIPGLSTVATSGSYPDLLNKPAIPQACVDVYDGRDGPPGPAGDPGPANSLAIGTVTTGDPGTSAGATITGTPPSQTLSLVIPRGDPGPAADVTQPNVLAALDDPTVGAVLWVQGGVGETVTAAKMGVKDSSGNAKQWTDVNGTMVRQCITADSAPAFKMLSSSGAVIYTVSCDNTMTFTGTVTIK